MNSQHVSRLVAMLDACKSAQFATFVYTAKGTGEVAKHTLVLNATTENLYGKDVEELQTLLPGLEGIAKVAGEELLNSRLESLEKGIGNNSQYTCADVYVSTGVRNVKIHGETGELHITGLSISKTVIVPGEYKQVKSSAKTIAKNAIRAQLSSHRFRQFALDNVARITMRGETMEVESD